MERAIDAGANRAREGLRVAEDCARFVAGDAALARALRELRHEVTRCVEMFASRETLLAERDVEGGGGASLESFSPEHIIARDKGVILEHNEPKGRADLRAIVTGAFKRSEEALRSLEEFSKLPRFERGMEASAGFERARYSLYELEKKALLITGIDGVNALTSDNVPPAGDRDE